MIQSTKNPFPAEALQPIKQRLHYGIPETFAFTTIGGEFVIPSAKEVARIQRANEAAARELNPASKYIHAFEGGLDAGNGLPYNIKGGKPGKNDAVEQARRELLTRRILASAPGNFI
jgi:hypothetical protein